MKISSVKSLEDLHLRTFESQALCLTQAVDCKHGKVQDEQMNGYTTNSRLFPRSHPSFIDKLPSGLIGWNASAFLEPLL